MPPLYELPDIECHLFPPKRADVLIRRRRLLREILQSILKRRTRAYVGAWTTREPDPHDPLQWGRSVCFHRFGEGHHQQLPRQTFHSDSLHRSGQSQRVYVPVSLVSLYLILASTRKLTAPDSSCVTTFHARKLSFRKSRRMEKSLLFRSAKISHAYQR